MTKILIVGTAPYDQNCQSRAFESYFHGMKHEELAQIFTYQYKPPKGHCGKLYQITDSMMFKHFFNPSSCTGIEYKLEDLNENDGIGAKKRGGNTDHKISEKLIASLYKFGKVDRPITYLLRGILWHKHNWCTERLNKWLEDFCPDCVFLSFSDDFFIPNIALYVAEKFNIPIISSIADDYFFNEKKTVSLFYGIYRKKYKNLINRILRRDRSTAIFVGDKIRDRYNGYFGIKGITMYLTSDIKRREFRPINTCNPIISYYGNIRLGRYKSLIDIGKALQNINKRFVLNVYSNENDTEYINEMKKADGIIFHGSVPYAQVQKGMLESDILIIVESFDPVDVITVKYSISTKVPDTMATGAQILAYGDKGCGAIDYMISTNAVYVCTQRDRLEDTIKEMMMADPNKQKKMYDDMATVVGCNHRIENNVRRFQRLINEIIGGDKLCITK